MVVGEGGGWYVRHSGNICNWGIVIIVVSLPQLLDCPPLFATCRKDRGHSQKRGWLVLLMADTEKGLAATKRDDTGRAARTRVEERADGLATRIEERAMDAIAAWVLAAAGRWGLRDAV